MVSDVDTMLRGCAAGVGVAQVMELSSRAMLGNGDLIEPFPDWPEEVFPFFALFPSRQYRATKVVVFVEFCLQVLSTHS